MKLASAAKRVEFVIFIPIYLRINPAHNLLDTVLISTEYFYTLLDKRKVYRNKERLIVYTRAYRPVYLSFHPLSRPHHGNFFSSPILSHMLNVYMMNICNEYFVSPYISPCYIIKQRAIIIRNMIRGPYHTELLRFRRLKI